jgi:CBS domain-containing protein
MHWLGQWAATMWPGRARQVIGRPKGLQEPEEEPPMSTSVTQVLESKGSNVYTVGPHETITTVLEIMATNNIGCVVVLLKDRLLGVFSERDYVRKVQPHGDVRADTPVEKLMTSNVLTVSPTQTVDDCMNMMTDNRVRHLPVVDAGRLVGVISIGDVVKAVIAEQEHTIRQLSSYISGDLSA